MELKDVKIRAIAYHAPLPEKFIELREYVDNLIRFSFDELRKILSRETGLEVFTRRVVFPYYEDFKSIYGLDLERFVALIYEELGERKDIDFISIPFAEYDKNYMDVFPELLLNYPKLFLSLKYDPLNILEDIELLKNISVRGGWINATHFAFSFGNQLVTPYFPATLSDSKGITFSLLYPNFLLNHSKEEKDLEKSITYIAKHLLSKSIGVIEEFKETGKLIGIDYSLSPWMNDSVANLLEKLNGLTFSLPGTLSRIFEINNVLLRISMRYRGVGYNEIMLPLAEDNHLKYLAKSGEIFFSDFLSFISVCVAGLDMIPIPSWTDIRILEGVFNDLYSLAQHKGRTIGLRLILVDAEPGEEVDLGIFGKTPVLDPIE